MEAATEDRMLTAADVARRLNLCRTSFHTRRALGAIGPQPRRTLGRPKWSSAELAAWLANPDERGELYDAERWPAVWREIQRKQR